MLEDFSWSPLGLISVVVYYRTVIIYFFSVFEVGLFKPALTTMAGGCISTSDLPSYILDGLFHSFMKTLIG